MLPCIRYGAKSVKFKTCLLKRQCHEIFYLYFLHESNPPGPSINWLKWFCLNIHFREYIRIHSSKNSTPCSVILRRVEIFDKLVLWNVTKNVGLCCISTHIYFLKINILNQGKERPAKTKLLSAKLCAVWYTFVCAVNFICRHCAVWYCAESDFAQYHTAIFRFSKYFRNIFEISSHRP